VSDAPQQNIQASPLTFRELSREHRLWEQTNEISTFLSSHNNQLITIRGFLYKTENENWILSEESNLKSCCVGSTSKMGSQMEVKSMFTNTPSLSAITLRGTLQVQPNNPTHFYTLQEATLLTNSTSFDSLAFVALAVGIAIFLYFIAYRRNKDPKPLV
jgi:hypothetical protein